MTSMTGYAYQEISTEEALVSVEIKSLNSRFLDISMNMPPFLGRLESGIRKECTQHIIRGKVDVYIKLQDLQPQNDVSYNTAVALAYAHAFDDIAATLGRQKEDIPLSFILSQPDVLITRKEHDIERYRSLIEPVFTAALTQFCDDRKREGENLKADLLTQLSHIEDAAHLFSSASSQMEDVFRSQVTKRFTEFLGNAVDEQRILTEIAALLVRYTINEEVVRLHSHIDSLKHEINHSIAPGRKLDFLCQELNREITTIGSKSQMKDISEAVINAKQALENIKEQCRNVE
ncbi:MAG: YicC/YloC family endoribonuclease [Spirochaetales bacterium]